jgi:N-carbamoylputrescine amidase
LHTSVDQNLLSGGRLLKRLAVAAIQMACSVHTNENIEKAEKLIREAASHGAQLIVLQELFETPYFCKTEKLEYYYLASSLQENPAINRLSKVAEELKLVIPVSFYEKANNARYNSAAIIDADGSILGVYRKAHIPDGPGYEEKFYFNPGDTGFRVWDTAYGRIGVGICWDQWFPEAARAMCLQGAEILVYPTAIGSEPDGSGTESMEHWQLCMQGHAAANIVPVVAANRIGSEEEEGVQLDFYGSSFLTDAKGKILSQASKDKEQIIYADYDLEEIDKLRTDWAVFRDRRPDLYGTLMSMDGSSS